MEANEYFENLEKAVAVAAKPQPLPDEVVWLEIFKATVMSPIYSSNPNNTLSLLADEGLKKFKERFRNDNITD